jgi:hypothetical protein
MRYYARMPLRVEPMDVPKLVALVNDWSTRSRQVGHRAAPPASALTGDALGAGPAEATAVADRLHAVFSAADSVERAHMVSAMLAEAAVQPELAPTGDVLTAAWTVPESQDALLASTALALREHLAAHPDRMGVCADRQCADVYVDTSPAGHRRFCSLTCQNRSRAAVFRERRRNTRAARTDG